MYCFNGLCERRLAIFQPHKYCTEVSLGTEIRSQERPVSLHVAECFHNGKYRRLWHGCPHVFLAAYSSNVLKLGLSLEC